VPRPTGCSAWPHGVHDLPESAGLFESPGKITGALFVWSRGSCCQVDTAAASSLPPRDGAGRGATPVLCEPGLPPRRVPAPVPAHFDHKSAGPAAPIRDFTCLARLGATCYISVRLPCWMGDRIHRTGLLPIICAKDRLEPVREFDQIRPTTKWESRPGILGESSRGAPPRGGEEVASSYYPPSFPSVVFGG